MEPLVSILIITYNSSKTVVETLESAREQTYEGPIELVVSDDCSTDNTVEVSKQWIDKNGERFVSCKVIESKENTGVSANCNRAVVNASGEWAKLIAGDDLLLPNCLTENLLFTKEHKEALFLFSKMSSFTVTSGRRTIKEQFPRECCINMFEKTSEEQHQSLYERNEIPAPTLFCHLPSLKENLYNERYRFCEDYPQWFSLTGKGYKLYFNPVETVLYRLNESLSVSKKLFYNPLFWESLKQFFYTEMADDLKQRNHIIFNRWSKALFMSDFAIHVLRNRPGLVNNLLFKIIYNIYK